MTLESHQAFFKIDYIGNKSRSFDSRKTENSNTIWLIMCRNGNYAVIATAKFLNLEEPKKYKVMMNFW
jgi:hypothetical protein